jgi:uncharacterized protein (DUF2461 family)
VRFSRDKSPYKTTTYGVVHGIPSTRAPLYAQLSEGGLFVGSGYYVLDGGQLQRFRDAVADDRAGPELEEAVGAVREAGVETFGEALKTAPRGYPREHPRVVLLRHRSLIAGQRLEATPKGIARLAALKHARRLWDVMTPLNAWLDEHVGPSDAPESSRYRGRRR